MSIGRLADKVLSLVVPKMTASAVQQTTCMYCSSTYSKRCVRDCIQDRCEAWRCDSCGTC